MIEAYNNCLKEHFVIMGEIAYPINTIVPRDDSGREGAMRIEENKPEGMAVSATEVAQILQRMSGDSERWTQEEQKRGEDEMMIDDDDKTVDGDAEKPSLGDDPRSCSF